MSKVTAKVKLQSKMTLAEGFDHECVKLDFVPDYNDGRNREWSVATPALSLSMSVKPEVAKLFEAGQAFTLVFEPESEG